HHPADVPHARRADLGDHVVDDLLQLVLGEGFGHELLEHRQLTLLGVCLLLPASGAEGLGSLGPALALALKDLQLLVVVKRPLKLLLGRAEARQDQAKGVASLSVARDHRLLELAFEPGDEAHPAGPHSRPPRTCQCRWKIVWPAPSPTLTTSR